MESTDVTPEAKNPPETQARSYSGVAALCLALLVLLAGVVGIVIGIIVDVAALWIVGIILIIAAIVVLSGLYMISPGQAAVLTLFGDYRGTDRHAGLRFINPLISSTKISLRVRNFTNVDIKSQ